MRRIGVDASCWSNRRGFGRFARELLIALAKIPNRYQYVFFADQQTVDECQFPAGVEVFSVPTSAQAIEAASASGRRSISDLWKMSRAVKSQSVNLFFFPTLYSFYPIFNRTKLVLTVMDMTPALFPDSVFPNKKLQFFWYLKERIGLWQADRIVTISEHSKQQIVRLRGIAPSKISVISAAPENSFQPHDNQGSHILERWGISKEHPYLLYVGGISPHKNLKMLLTVFAKLIQDPKFSDYKLILAGDFEKDSFYSDYPALQYSIENLQLSAHVIFTGYVDDSQLASLYRSASLFVFPSLQEGFGLPAIEAMACGAPVVASNAGSIPEVVGDAAELCDPTDPDSMLVAIRKILADPARRNQMRRRGLERAKMFTWDRAARQILAVFDSM